MFDDDEREPLPLDARAIHQRLVSDSSRWACGLPADTRLADFARAVPHRMSLPSPSSQQTRDVLAHRRPSSTLPDVMSSKGQASMFKNQTPGRARVASIAAIAVVMLLVGVLYTAHSVQGTRGATGGGPGNKTVVVPTATPLPHGEYNATPGPLVNYVAELYTTGDYPSDGVPVIVKSHFVTGDWVYVVTVVHGLPNGRHTISIKWYKDVAGTEVPFYIPTSQTASDRRLVFGLLLAEPGAYMARIYIDRPASDAGDLPSDPYLAGTVAFEVAAP